MAKQTTEHLKLVTGNTVDSDQVLPDIAGNFTKLDDWAVDVDEQLAEVADNAPNLAAETLARVQGDQQLTVGLTAAQADIEDLQDALPAKADLVDGRLHPAQIPPLAISNTTPVVDESAMLALTAEPGDIAKRLDLPGAPPFILVASPASTLANWLRLIGDYALAADLAATTALIDPRGSDSWLIGRALGQAYLLTGNQTYDATHGTLTASDIQWEDGTSGHFAVTELDSNGAVTESTTSYDLVGTSKVVIVTTPRNPAGQVLGAMRFSHQETVPVEGCDRRRWPGLQRVVRDFQPGPSEQAPAKRHSALGRLAALTCKDASLVRPWTANPAEKTSMTASVYTAHHYTATYGATY